MRRRAPTVLLFVFLSVVPLWGLAQDPTPATRGPTPGEVERAVEDVFADASYQKGLETTHLTAEELERLFVRGVDYLFARIQDFLRAIYKISPVLYYVLVAGLLITLIALLIHLGWTFTRAFRGVGEGEAAEGVVVDGERVRRYRDLRSEARALASQGNPREGTRTLLLALLALLAEAEVFQVARSWTPREILERVSARGTFGAELGAFGAGVEDALYAEREVTLEAFEACERTLEDLTRGVRGLGRAEAIGA